MNLRLRTRQILPTIPLAVVVIAAAISPTVGATAPPAAAPQAGPVEVFGPVVAGEFNGNLRDLPRAPEWAPGEPIKEIPRRHVVRSAQEHASAPRGYDLDPLYDSGALAARMAPRAFSSSSLNFAGLGYSGANPPDPAGDVGRDYYIQMINGPGTQVSIHNKGDGSTALTFTLHSLASSGPCQTGLGDPIVLYDHLADRWLLSEFSSSGNNLCVYISKTSDPISGGWWLYNFTAPSFPDYPKYSVWPDAYYITTNESSPAVYALDRMKMLQGAAAMSQRVTASSLAGFGFQTLTPGDLDGDRLPPPNAPAIFMRHRDDEAHNAGSNNPAEDYLEIWEFAVDWVPPAPSAFSFVGNIAVAEFDSDLCGYFVFNCFPQPGGTGVLLDSLREVIMWRLAYRNFGSHESLVGNFVTDVTGTDVGGVRWFELRRTGPGVGSWSLYQEGTWAFGSPNVNSWMGSIAMDGAGNIALGYNVVNAIATYPSLRYTGRLSTDTLGTMSFGSNSIIEGSASNSSIRYGDYNALTLDPVDDCTFWFTGEYNPATTWGTRVATFRFDRCPNELDTFVGEDEPSPSEGTRSPE